MLVNFYYFKEVCGFLKLLLYNFNYFNLKKKKGKKFIFEDLFKKYLSFKIV